MREVIGEVQKASAGKVAVLVKMNMADGFKGGMEQEECLEVAKTLEELGVDAIVLSGGFVSKAPMYILRGTMPIDTLASGIRDFTIRTFVRAFGKYLIPTVPFKEAYFLEDALKFRKALNVPLVYVGGLINRRKIDEVLDKGFDFVAFARALIKDPDFINKMINEDLEKSTCDTCNYCIAVMYNDQVSCIQNE